MARMNRRFFATLALEAFMNKPVSAFVIFPNNIHDLFMVKSKMHVMIMHEKEGVP